MIGRRDFITLLGGAAGWPLAARAQQGGKIYRIGFQANDLLPLGELWLPHLSAAASTRPGYRDAAGEAHVCRDQNQYRPGRPIPEKRSG